VGGKKKRKCSTKTQGEKGNALWVVEGGCVLGGVWGGVWGGGKDTPSKRRRETGRVDIGGLEKKKGKASGGGRVLFEEMSWCLVGKGVGDHATSREKKGKKEKKDPFATVNTKNNCRIGHRDSRKKKKHRRPRKETRRS